MIRCLRQAVAVLATAPLAAHSAPAQTASTYTITSTSPSSIPAGAAGATLALSGTLPDFSQGTYKVCFYTGAGSAAPITPTTTAGVATISVPAASIQGIDPATFTTANGFAVQALVYILAAGTTCDGTSAASLTNSLSVPIVEPLLGSYAGPTSIPRTNASTGIQAPPATLLLTGSNFAANTIVTFGTYTGVTSRVLTANSIAVSVPSSFSASGTGTTATLKVCNTGGTASFCSSPASPLTLTVAGLYPSIGTLTASPSPATNSSQTTLSAQFSRGSPSTALPEPGAPSGSVSFTAGSAAIAAAPLVLDPTATFVQQTSAVSTPVASAPTISPAAGTYLNSVTVSLIGATAGSALYYTLDGSTPTTASTAYTGPFAVTSTSTVQAIAAAAGLLNSAVATAAYTITVTPPAKLAFVVQPSSAALNTAIAPPLQVAIQDANGNTVTNSTLPVTIALARNPAYSTLSGTTTVNAVNGIATFADLSLNNISTGNTFIASSGNLTTTNSTTFTVTPYPLTMAVQSALVGINSTLNGTVTLGHAAPVGGLTVALASDTRANVTISPATLTVAANQTTGSFTYTGVAAGSATLSATATNYQTGTVQVTGTAAQVSLGTIPSVAPGQSVSLALSLPSAAPPGGTTVTFTSSNTGVATVTSSITVPAGQRTATTNPQINGITIGTTTIVASAPGFAPDTRAASVTVVASFSPSSSNINLATSTNTLLTISAPAPAGGVAFTLTSDAPGTATVGSSVTIPASATSAPISLTGVANGSTTVRANSPGVVEATTNVNVNSTISFSPASVATGVSLQTTLQPYLPISSPTPITVTITSANPAIATISKTLTDAGGTTLTFTNVTSAGYTGTIYVQGQSIGTTTLTVSAPGFTTGTVPVTVGPSGFAFVYSNDFSTTNFSSPSSLTVTPVVLNPGSLTLNNYPLQLNPGIGTVSVPVTSRTVSVGTITTSPVVFSAGDGGKITSFQPVSAGTSIITLGTPAGFSTPSSTQPQYSQVTATVKAPTLSFNSNPVTGLNLQTTVTVYVPVAPPSPVTITVTSSNPAIVTLSTSPTVIGTPTLTFTTASVPTIYVQGKSIGATTLTVSAPGYSNGTAPATVDPSGFAFIYSNDFSTTSFSAPTGLTVTTAVLSPGSLSLLNYNLALIPGIGAVSVPVASATTAVGTIKTSPVVFNAGDNGIVTSFQPVSAGTSAISVGTPTGFSTPAQPQYTQITATVTAPALTLSGDRATGVNLETTISAYVPVAPPNPVTVTVTIAGPTTAKISTSATVVGSSSLTFPNISAAGYLPTIYIQGQTAGSTTITVSAPGYTSATANIAVYPSGFAFINSSSFSTTTFSTPTNLNISTAVLNPGTLTLFDYGLQINPGVAAISVPVTSGSTSVGTIVTSPVVFNPGDTGKSTTFQPVAAGTSTIAIGTPTGYSTPSQSQYTQMTATVTAPTLTFNTNPVTGVNLETIVYPSLPVTPPNPVTVTVTSNGASIATISTSGTVVGGTTLTFTNVTSAGYLPPIYVQGQSVGSTTLTVSAPGFTNGNATVAVYPSGFGFSYSGGFSTTTFSAPTSVTISPLVLNPGTLTVYSGTFQVNPGIGTVSVPVTSGTPSVGSITTSPVVFPAGSNGQTTTFKPASAGTSVISLGTPAGYSTPSQSQYTQFTATVTAPTITLNTNDTGVNLQTNASSYLQVTPPSPVTVTITSSDPSIATLSTSRSTAGVATLTFSNVTSSVPSFYIQGQAVGTVIITASAPGYMSATSTETVGPSGFAFGYTTSVSTTATSSPTSLYVYPFILNSGTLTAQTTAVLNPNTGTITVPVTSSNPVTGVITTSPLLFNGGDSYQTTTFKPLTTGTTTLTVQPPAGYSTPSQYQQITATVQ